MNRRSFLKAMGAGAAGMRAALSLSTEGGASRGDESAIATEVMGMPEDGVRRPNILWICTDQQRYDTIGCLGNAHIHTPNLDRLCAAGVAFTQAYSQNPICSPSRASFLTGLYPSTIHVNRNGLPRFPEHPRVKLITKRLAEVGYDCGLSGKLHIASAWNGVEERTDDGYRRFWYSHAPRQEDLTHNQYVHWLLAQGLDLDEVFQKRRDGRYVAYRQDVPASLHQTTWCTDRAIDFIQEDRQSPWLMSVNVFDPHPPFDAPAEYADRYDPQSLPAPLFQSSDLEVQERLTDFFFQGKPGPPGERQQQNKASYYGMVELIDEQVGRLLDLLEGSGQLEHTVVIFTSDHGEMLGDHGLTAKGCRFYEGAVHVPLIISWPGHFKAGRRSSALVELTDIAPTLAEMSGIPLEWTHGKSLLPLLMGEAGPDMHREHVRCEYYDTLNMRAPHNQEKHTSCWATMHRDQRYKLVAYHGLDYGELYDLQNDPEEFENLWEDPHMVAVKADLIKSSFDASIVISDPGPKLTGRY